MATAATIKKNIAKLEAALKSKATPKSLKPKLETQLVKSKAELSGMNKGTKPKTSSTKSTQTALQKLKAMVNKNKKYKTYKGAGVDLEKDADRPALKTGRRIAKESGKTYYEYRANRIDVKQPPKKYPKLEKGGKTENAKEVWGNMSIKERMDFLKDEYKDKIKGDNLLAKRLQDESKLDWDDLAVKIQMELEKNISKMAKGGKVKNKFRVLERVYSYQNKDYPASIAYVRFVPYDSVEFRHPNDKYVYKLELKDGYSNWINEESLHKTKQKEYADGGMSQGYDDREDERLGMKDGKMSMKDLDSTHARRDDARFEERGKMDMGGEIYAHADKMTDSEFESELKGLKESERKKYDTLVRLGDSKKLALATVLYKRKHPQTGESHSYLTMAKGGSIRTLYKQFNQEKPNILLIMIADDVASDFMREKFDKTVDWSKLSDSEKEKYNEDYRVNKTSFENYLMSEFVKLYYSDDSIKEKCKGSSHKTIDSIKSVMKDLAKKYPQDKYAEGGISEKEVVESNAEMVLSQIKAVKHHAQELSNVVSKNSDIEAWVVAKIERASTDLSDITHYLEFQTKKMAMGGEIHRTQD